MAIGDVDANTGNRLAYVEAEVLPTCAELGIGFVPWSPLGQGFLAGKVDATMAFESTDVRSWFPRFTADARAANQPIVDLLNDLATRHNFRR